MTGKTIGFIIRHFGERGTEVAIYDYADCNENILKNKSIIIHFPESVYRNNNLTFLEESYNKFNNRFKMIEMTSFSEANNISILNNIDCIYMLTAGGPEHYLFTAPITATKYFIHCVFTTEYPFGDVYVPISEYLNKRFNTSYPVLPHMVRVGDTTDNLREQLKIPTDAKVIGRYGGYKEFDIQYVKDTIIEVATRMPTTYFLFMNTEKFCNLPNVIFLSRQIDINEKRKFINTCDVFLHAREGGETFGLSIAEFAVCLKPIITTRGTIDNAHLDILGDDVLLYFNKDGLRYLLENYDFKTKNMSNNGYLKYRPEPVMEIFSKLI